MDHRKQNFLQKLYCREVHGTFIRGRPVVHNKPLKLFGSIPERFMFHLRYVIEPLTNHILVGTTRCGQFLITYSYAADLRLPVQMQFKYRLHWWAFQPGAQAQKVAEVQLFDNQDIRYALRVGVAQWPNVNDRLIVYGYSDDECDALYDQEDGGLGNRRYYITVTTMPSLHDCRDCKTVAESFDEEDMAANWDSCVCLSCLKHGLTIHTTLDVAPPFPTFDPLTNLKIDNKIIVNTGNFLHVLSFALGKEEIQPSKDDTIQPGDICHKIGEMLSNDLRGYNCPWKKAGNTSSLNSRKTVARSINKAWLNTIMDKAEKVYAFEDSDDGCEPRFKWFKKRRLADKMYEFCSDDEDMENKCPAKISRDEEPSMYSSTRLDHKMVVNHIPIELKKNVDADKECWKNSSCVRNDSEVKENLVIPDEPIFFKKPRRERMDVDYRRQHSETQNKFCVPNNKTCDHDESNECDNHTNKILDKISTMDNNRNMSGPQQNLVDIVSCKSDCDSFNKLVSSDSHSTSVSSTSEIEAVPSKSDYHKIPTLDMSIINPDLSVILAEWEAESVSSLSPRSDSFLYKNCETKNDIIQSFLELIPGMTISPRSSSSSWAATSENIGVKVNDGAHTASKVSSPNSSSVNKYSPLLVVLRTRNCNQDKEPQKKKEQEDKYKGFAKEDVSPRVKCTKEADISMRQRMISGCSVCFDRMYIEVDEEIISTITDIEDDDQGTGFHCALPLSVHGSAYAQLQMISSQKAEKMGMHCERVYQTSLDIEQFCFKAADIICKCEGFKFWFCNDYDVEIIDVCAFNGDILGVVCMRVNAEKKPSQNEKYSTTGNQRYFYDVSCVFVWNPSSDQCWLETYSSLVDVTRRVSSQWGAAARREAERLRHHLQTSTLFTLPPYPPIRNFEHRLWTDDILCPSVDEIRDYTNLIGFRLFYNRPRNGIIAEFGID